MPKKGSSIRQRKSDHIQINLEQDVRSGLTTGLENYRFRHKALPEMDLDAVKLDTSIFGKKISAPLFISSMTGGTEKAGQINRILAAAAQETGIPMGVGSQRVALENPEVAESFAVRDTAPDILLFANLGAIQLNYELAPDDCQKAVEMIDADALILHLNPLQEAVMDGGNTNFTGLTKKIESVCRSLSVPVIIKEVGWGISGDDAARLKEAGVSAIDIAGAGGTSWTEVEMHRAKTKKGKMIASAFVNWGIPTSESIVLVRAAAPDLPIFASGGIRNGLEIAKTIALGAMMGGLASPFLKAADQSLDAVVQEINRIKREIQISMFAVGAGDLDQLSQTPLFVNTQTHIDQDHN
jgi:isopentenyl-diphosphate delta-isomerase